MTPKEAIEAIKSNWPPSNYTMLREALTLAVELLETKADPETPTLTTNQATDAVKQTITEWWGEPTEAEWAGLKLILDKHLQQQNGG